ncbi:MAG TPA: YajG family lipoprotein [Methylomirabilota bacterium]
MNRALLASVAPRRVQIGNVDDRRRDTARVGTKPGGEGDIVTSRPVADIVREALGLEMDKNGHLLVSDRPDVVLRPAVEVFSFDAVEGYSSVQYVGKVVIALTVADGRTGGTLLTRRYAGIRRRQVDKPDPSQWREVLDTALARAMHDLATDPDLVAALSGSPPPPARPAA